jgi:hypothetical protein
MGYERYHVAGGRAGRRTGGGALGHAGLRREGSRPGARAVCLLAELAMMSRNSAHSRRPQKKETS